MMMMMMMAAVASTGVRDGYGLLHERPAWGWIEEI